MNLDKDFCRLRCSNGGFLERKVMETIRLVVAQTNFSACPPQRDASSRADERTFGRRYSRVLVGIDIVDW